MITYLLNKMSGTKLMLLILVITSCSSNIPLYQKYFEDNVGELDNPVLVFQTNDSMFVCTKYEYLHDMVYKEHYSVKFRKYDSFFMACVQRKVNPSKYLNEYLIDQELAKEASNDFETFINTYCETRNDGIIIKSHDPNIAKILFEKGYYIRQDCYWGYYKAEK